MSGTEWSESAAPPIAFSFKLFFAVVGLTDKPLPAILKHQQLRSRFLTKKVVSHYCEDMFFYKTYKEVGMTTKNTEPPEDFWTEADMRQFEADFEMAVDMFEMALDEQGKGLPNTDKNSLLERFKNSEYESAKMFRL